MDLFFRTRMGQRFFEHTLPKFVDELARLNANLEALVAELRRRDAARATDEPAPAHPGRKTP